MISFDICFFVVVVVCYLFFVFFFTLEGKFHFLVYLFACLMFFDNFLAIIVGDTGEPRQYCYILCDVVT